MAVAFSTLISDIQDVLGDSSIELENRINDAVMTIAAGIRMPDGSTSPPLPELMQMDTVATTSLAYVAMPDTYQRALFYVVDENEALIKPVSGGSYYSFTLFLNSLSKRDMSQTGSVDRVCVKGRYLYYQGIPSSSEDLLLYFYRKPVDMALDIDTPDGIPDHLQNRLIRHYVCRERFGEGLEDGDSSRAIGAKYHTEKFFEAMIDLIDFVGKETDVEPVCYEGDYDIDLDVVYD